MQDRLCLVVARVADGHGACASRSRHLREPVVTGAPRVGLESTCTRRLPAAQIKREPQRFRQPLDELGILPGRLATHAVIEMRNRQQ